MLVIRDDKRVRLLSRNGSDWTERCPWIAEAALKNRQKHFDGEAVILGSTASPSTRCIRARTITRCSFTLSTFSRWAAMTCANSRCTFASPNLSGC
ncbi:hypothetical protein Q2941_40805 [Bradyrhizobium sp. UFLA05-153]